MKTVYTELHADGYYWEDMSFSLYFTRPLLQDMQTRIQALLNGWFWIGYYGAYGGNLLHWSAIGFDANIVEWAVDMSQVTPNPEVALNSLLECLETFSEKEGIPIEKLVVGNELTE